MSRTIKLLFILSLVLSLVLAACAPTSTELAPTATEAPPATEASSAAGAPAAGVALKVTGDVANQQAWTEEEVKAMNAIEVDSTNSKGEASTYTGVPLNDLLALAQPNADATTVVFMADDGYTAEISLEELNACNDCIASFRSNGGFSTVLPGYPGSMQVKGLIEIQVK